VPPLAGSPELRDEAGHEGGQEYLAGQCFQGGERDTQSQACYVARHRPVPEREEGRAGEKQDEDGIYRPPGNERGQQISTGRGNQQQAEPAR
jgi:hypothetical protein